MNQLDSTGEKASSDLSVHGILTNLTLLSITGTSLYQTLQQASFSVSPKLYTAVQPVELFSTIATRTFSWVIYNIQLITSQRLYGKCFRKQMNQMDVS